LPSGSVDQAISDPLTFTFATLVTGLSYSIAAKFVLQFGASIPSKKDFYQYQRIVADQIHVLAQRSLRIKQDQLTRDEAIGIDGASDHRRKGSLCVITMMHPRCRAILDYQVMMKPKQYVKGNVSPTESSNNLEKLGVIELVSRWKGHPSIRYYIHDNDGRTRNAITSAGWNIIEVLDPGQL
jgi:hypothetical protein